MEWRDWRCEVILDWSVQIRNIIDVQKPGILHLQPSRRL